MITRLLLIPFLGKWHNYAHFTAGYIIAYTLSDVVGAEAGFLLSIGATLGKETADLALDGRWTWTDVIYGVAGAVVAYAIKN